ncbi:MAG: type II secretion system F family protein [Mesorhizobium sp.]|uniref:type II secretion system F family protein n=1 Tax=Mesorhizobium sp. TaxID=1871066 RepID=UPI000FEA74D6|nr:type II secretion system F family protein [Mesorhizobium sp.]RWM12886.1 MAG: type II secretion system F family protein [Mesorhizobium sp.]
MNFTYRAYYGQGKEETGTLEAGDAADAARTLAARGRIAFELKPADRDTRRQPIAATRMQMLQGRGRFSQARLFLDLAILTEAGLTLPQALRGLLAGEALPAQRKVIETIAMSMSSGRTAAESFALIDGMQADTIALVASGERAHQMPVVMRALATQMVERDRKAAELRNALTYPAFLLVMMCLAFGVVVLVLVPSLAPIFENSGQPPPVMITVLGAVRDMAFDPLSQAAGVVLTAALISLALPQMRKIVSPFAQRLILSLPLVGTAIHKTNSARYLSSLSMLVGGGTPMTEALSLASRCNPLARLRTSLKSVRDQVASGDRLPVALERTRQFDPKIISLLSVGDEVNRLPIVLSRAAAILEEEAKTTMSRLIAALTPTITIVLGLVIGGLVVSVMTTLLSINDLAVQG